jgi:Flp pilus assembly protein TadD
MGVSIRAGAWGLGLVLLTACGSPKPAEEPEPAPVTDPKPATKSVPPSSAKVKQGMDALSAQNFSEAERLLSLARTEEPKDPQAAFYHGVALEGLERQDDAKLAYEKALELDPRLIEASQNLSALLVEADQAEAALEVADKGLAIAPEDPGLLGNRALALGALGSPEAEAAFQKALNKRPEDGWLRYYYAAVLVLEKKTALAQAELKKIKILDPALGVSVSELYGVLRDFSGCVAALDQALAKQQDAELLTRRGRCKVGLKDMSGAEADFRAVVALVPKEPIGHFYLGKHLLATGNKVEGKKELTLAKELGPGTPFGKEAAETLAGK